MALRVWVVPPADEIEALSRRLAASDRRLESLNRRTVNEITLTAMAVVKAKARGLPTRPPEDRGRRRQLAAGVGRRRTAHGYRVTTSMPTPELAFYPRAIMSQWRHPTFGGSPIVTQVERWDWFLGPISDLHGEMELKLRDNIEDAFSD